MSSCFSVLSITIVNRREMGLLKRLRLSPAPTWILMSAIFINTMIVCVIQIVLMLAVGRGFGVHGPANWVPFLLALVVGMFGFTALGMGVSTLVPNADAAGPVVNIVFFVVLAFSGLYFPITPGSTLANITDYLPGAQDDRQPADSFNHIPGTSPWAWHNLRDRHLGGRRRLPHPAAMASGRPSAAEGPWIGCVTPLVPRPAPKPVVPFTTRSSSRATEVVLPVTRCSRRGPLRRADRMGPHIVGGIDSSPCTAERGHIGRTDLHRSCSDHSLSNRGRPTPCPASTTASVSRRSRRPRTGEGSGRPQVP